MQLLMRCFNEIQGVQKIALYNNKNVIIRRPDPSKENEVDIIAHAAGGLVISDWIEHPEWKRIIKTGKNYTNMYDDTFMFLLHGVDNEVPEQLEALRTNRNGYIVEIITKNNSSYVFPTPVFFQEKTEKKINMHSWMVELTYRVPTKYDKFIKLNTLIQSASYISTGGSNILGSGVNTAIVSQ